MLAGINKIKLVPCSKFEQELVDSRYINIPFTPLSAFMKTQRKDTADGSVTSVNIECFVLCCEFDNLDLANVLNELLVVKVIDNDLMEHEWGNNDFGLKCSFTFSTGKKPGEGKGYKLKFTGKIC